MPERLKAFRKKKRFIVLALLLASVFANSQITGFTRGGSTCWNENNGFQGTHGGTIEEEVCGANHMRMIKDVSWDNFEFYCSSWTASTTQTTAGAIVFRWSGTGSYYALTKEEDTGIFKLKKNNISN